jgi:hypothetical protein
MEWSVYLTAALPGHRSMTVAAQNVVCRAGKIASPEVVTPIALEQLDGRLKQL